MPKYRFVDHAPSGHEFPDLGLTSAPGLEFDFDGEINSVYVEPVVEAVAPKSAKGGDPAPVAPQE